jgi:outer membrane lipoprotein SlyB
MFLQGFTKTATTVVTMTPEEYYDLAREKDPLVGTLLGAASGAAVGGIKGAKKKKARSALIGAGLGSAAGAVSGHQLSKLIKHYQSKRVHNLAEELKLRSAPRRSAYSE